MNILKINIPEGFKIKQFDEKTGEVSFEPIPKDIKELIKTFDDVLKHHNITLTEWSHRINNLLPDEVAYIQLKLIAQALNEGWTPDWTNSNDSKYYPWFDMGSASDVGVSCSNYVFWNSVSIGGSRLCFKSRELAKYAGNQFIELYKAYFTV